MAGTVGLEPTTIRLTAVRSAIELHPKNLEVPAGFEPALIRVRSAVDCRCRRNRILVLAGGFEPPTSAFAGLRSDPLSYASVEAKPCTSRRPGPRKCGPLRKSPQLVSRVRRKRLERLPIGYRPGPVRRCTVDSGNVHRTRDGWTRPYLWCSRRDSNPRPLPSEGSALVHLSYASKPSIQRRDPLPKLCRSLRQGLLHGSWREVRSDPA
jgi:hypothetical protein